MRYLLVISSIWSAGAVAQGLLDERIVLASKLARTVIIEARSKDSLFFEQCQYAPPAAHGHVHGPGHGQPDPDEDGDIAANHLTNCNPVGPILPNTTAAREYLEQRFVEALNHGLLKLDQVGYAGSIAGASIATGIITGAAFAGLESWAGRARPSGVPRPRDVLTVFGLTGVVGAGMMLWFKVSEARDARYEQRRSKQIQNVIDLRIPPEPVLIDERLTSRAEAREVMRLFVRALTTAAERTRRAAPHLAPDTP